MDIHFIAKPTGILAAWTHFHHHIPLQSELRNGVRSRSGSLALCVNDDPAKSKCSVFSFKGVEYLRSSLSSLPEFIVRAHDGIRCLCAPIGSDAFCKSFCLDIAEACRPAFDRISVMENSQVAYHFLRVCMLPKFSYLIKTTPPRLVMDAAKAFDCLVMQCIASIMHCSPGDDLFTPECIKQATFGFQVGGLGLTSMEHSCLGA